MMKSFWIIIFVLSFGSYAFAQKASGKSVAKKVSAAKEALREKFDPFRDPVADLKTSVAAAISGKRIIIDVGGEWCVWCHILDNYLTANPELAKILDENYIWLKVNMSEENENKEFLSAYPAIKGYPHLFVLETDGSFLHSQDTAPLESKKSYDDVLFKNFLVKWAPKKKNAVQ
jgi:thiol:disulfide interchange protein